MFNNRKVLLRFVGWFFLINAILFCLIGYGYLKNIVLSPTLFVNSIADYSSIGGKFFVICFTLVNYISYMTLLAFIPAILVWIVSYCVPFKPLIWTISIILATLSVIAIISDTLIYAMFRFHINTTLLSMIFADHWTDLFDFSRREYELFTAIILVILCSQLIISWWVWNKVILTKRYQIGRSLALLWFGGFLFSYFAMLQSIANNNNLLSQQTPNLPLYNQLLAYLIPTSNAADILYRYSEDHFAQPLFTNDPLRYPLHALHCTPPAHPANIILIMVDSLRFDSLQMEYMPHLTQFAQSSWQFTNHLSGGNSTQPGLFSLFYSIPSNYWTAALEQKIPPVLMNNLIKYGYEMIIVWSNSMDNPPFNKTIYAGIANLKDGAPGEDIGNRDRYITQQALQFLNTHNQQTPFFLNLLYDAPHGYCRQQSYSLPFQPATAECSRIVMSNELNPLPYLNRYHNSVHFVDEEINKILQVIKYKGYLNNSVVLITADHGQEFNDNKQNYWGHASNYTRAQIQIPLIIHWPHQKPRTIEYVTSSYDVVPTLLKHLYQCKNPIMDYSIGQDLLSGENRLPFILSGSYTNMGLVTPARITTLRASGEIVITTPQAIPIDTPPDRVIIKKALKIMRMYYAN